MSWSKSNNGLNFVTAPNFPPPRPTERTCRQFSVSIRLHPPSVFAQLRRDKERGVREALTRNVLLPRLQIMPTVMRIGPYRFHFYSREGNEPPHIHVTREDMEAKFWLRPVALAANRGFASAELSRIHALVEEHCQTLIAAYIKTHGN